MSTNLRRARLKDMGMDDFSPKGHLKFALKSGDELTISVAKQLIEENEKYKKERKDFLRKYKGMLIKT